jgi:hypothetical protein
MSMSVLTPDRIPMSQKERDVLKILHGVLAGERTQAQAARLLGKSTRQVRRLQRKLERGGDPALVHGLRGQPSNHQPDPVFQRAVLDAYRQRYADFGPTFASEKLAEEGLPVSPQTLRRWLINAGLWQRQRRREAHRSRRPRRACFGELVQMDASEHDWLEGRGEQVVLVSMIDDATNVTLARFYPAGTTEAHLDLLGRWLRRYGRPLALYTDRHSIFEPQDKGRALPDAETQFGRAVRERLLPGHNRRFRKEARQGGDAHRPLGPGHNLAAILSIQEQRVVANDYTIRFRNRFYQLLKPIYAGERGGRVVIELRLDGSMAVRFGGHYLKYQEVPVAVAAGGSAPRPPEFSALAADASAGEEAGRVSPEGVPAPGVQPAGGRSGRTPAEPYPPDGAAEDSGKRPYRPAEDHPWRKGFKRKK